MLRLVVGFVIAAMASGMAVAQQPPQAKETTPAAMPKTEKERTGYAIGLDIGRMLKTRGLECDLSFLGRGIRDGIAGAKPAMTDQEIQETVQSAQKAAQGRVAAQNKAEADRFFAANAKKPGVKATKTGLQYQVLKEGTGPSPKPTDVVRTHYHGTFLDGKVFDSSVERGEPAEFPVNRVIAGWTEALQMMKVGSKWKLFVPSDLAYGEDGFGSIPPNTPLVFEVELLGIGKPEQLPGVK
jgi:FKBP-type peptidyl-prolyl cis-trans isomerase